MVISREIEEKVFDAIKLRCAGWNLVG